MSDDAGTIRSAFRTSTQLFVETAARLGRADWERPGLDDWSIRDLVGHTSRALSTVERGLDQGSAARDVESAVGYYIAVYSGGHGRPEAITARAREAGLALGEQPIATIEALAARVMLRVESADDTQMVTTLVGGMHLIDYLPTRVLELAVHTLDLALALRWDVSLPSAAATVTMRLLGEMAVAQRRAETVVLALTGRSALPASFAVL